MKVSIDHLKAAYNKIGKSVPDFYPQDIGKLSTSLVEARNDQPDYEFLGDKVSFSGSYISKLKAMLNLDESVSIDVLMTLYCEILSGNAVNESEVNQNAELKSLLSLSNDEMYFNGHLERLKELSLSIFLQKYKEIFGVEFKEPEKLCAKPDIDNYIPSSISESRELEELLKLSNDELYMTGKLERLLKLSPSIFQQKHKQIFGVEFKG